MFEINWQEIKTNFPKAYEEFITSGYFVERKGIHTGNIVNIIHSGNGRFVCYCDLEKFFDEQGIIIIIHYNRCKFWNSYYYNNTVEIDDIDNAYYTRPEAQKQAIIKAFEIDEAKENEK